MGDLRKRFLSALIFGPLVVLLFIFLPPKLLLLFLAIVLVLGAYEFSSMACATNSLFIAALTAVSLVPLYVSGPAFYPLWVLFSPALCLIVKMRARRAEASSLNKEIAKSIAVLVLAEVFLAVPLFFLYRLKELDGLLPLILLLTIWASDTAAYLLGKSIGRHKLAPLISPKKTFEGLLGALIGAAVVIFLFRSRLGVTLPVSIAFGALIGALGQLGDMLESIAKRVCEVKDSSRLIPGHGGLLDRVDSFLLTAPFVYCYFSAIGAMR